MNRHPAGDSKHKSRTTLASQALCRTQQITCGFGIIEIESCAFRQQPQIDGFEFHAGRALTNCGVTYPFVKEDLVTSRNLVPRLLYTPLDGAARPPVPQVA